MRAAVFALLADHKRQNTHQQISRDRGQNIVYNYTKTSGGKLVYLSDWPGLKRVQYPEKNEGEDF